MDLSTVPADVAEILREAQKIRIDPELYVSMVREWAHTGRYALSPEEVVRRSRPRSTDGATAAAHFELGEHLHSAGDHAAAITHWREAHRLDPDNWTYRRNAWNFEDPGRQGHTDAYDGSWYEDVRKIGAENYYPALEP
jgi:tetratricopeptide (TPR) repeat protein